MATRKTRTLVSRTRDSFCDFENIAQIDLWLIALTEENINDPTGEFELSPDERETAERFYHPIDARDFICRRSTLRRILSGYVGIEPEALNFAVNEFKKPNLTGLAHPLHFNVSHSDGYLIVAVSQHAEIGVDLERVLPLVEDIGEVAFTPAERAALDDLVPADRTRETYRLWTAKEAVLKAIGTGLATSPLDIEISFSETDGLGRVRSTAAHLDNLCPDRVKCFTPLLGFMAAVAVRAPATPFSLVQRSLSAGIHTAQDRRLC